MRSRHSLAILDWTASTPFLIEDGHVLLTPRRTAALQCPTKFAPLDLRGRPGRAAPDLAIVYDSLVLTHATALLTSTPEGFTDYVYADLRDPDTILSKALIRSIKGWVTLRS